MIRPPSVLAVQCVGGKGAALVGARVVLSQGLREATQRQRDPKPLMPLLARIRKYADMLHADRQICHLRVCKASEYAGMPQQQALLGYTGRWAYCTCRYGRVDRE